MKNKRLILLIPLLIGISSLSACNTSNSSNENTHESKDDNNDLSVDENLISTTYTDKSIKEYYASISMTKNNLELKNKLCEKISNHKNLTYGDLWTSYKTTDTNNEGKIICIYSNFTFNYGTSTGGQQLGNNTVSREGQYYNREHTTPRSWFGGSSKKTSMPEHNDLFNVYPTDAKVNNIRGTYDYGEVGNSSYTSSNGSKLGVSRRDDNVSTVFEIADEYKGDIARSYFYMATRYMKSTYWYNKCDSKVYSVTPTGINLSQHGIDLLLKWAHNDPVSEKEIARNNAIYALQGNRNPFIDYENLETYIWTPSANYLEM